MSFPKLVNNSLINTKLRKRRLEKHKDVHEELKNLGFDGAYKYGLNFFLDFVQKSLTINNLSFVQLLNKLDPALINDYKNCVKEMYTEKKIALRTTRDYYQKLNNLLRFLDEKSMLPFTFIPLTLGGRSGEQNFSPKYILGFRNYLNQKNLSHPYNYEKNVKVFLRYCSVTYNFSFDTLEDLKLLNLFHIERYHDSLQQKINNREIIKPTAYKALQSLKHFISYLNELKIVLFDYYVPKKFKESSNRSNEYVTSEELNHFIETLLKRSKDPLRDLAITLLLLDTGCRPIEVANIELEDYYPPSSEIILSSKKSGRRKIKISKEVKLVIDDYIVVRNSYKTEHNYLFVSKSMTKITSGIVSQLFCRYRDKSLGYSCFSPKALRHTFITNALDNGNTIDRVAEIVGHKYLISTLYYYYRDNKRFLTKTLQYNPINAMKEVRK